MKFTGLTMAEAEASRAKYGTNAIPEPAWTTFGQAFRATFRDPMIRILLVMAMILFIPKKVSFPLPIPQRCSIAPSLLAVNS